MEIFPNRHFIAHFNNPTYLDYAFQFSFCFQMLFEKNRIIKQEKLMIFEAKISKKHVYSKNKPQRQVQQSQYYLIYACQMLQGLKNSFHFLKLIQETQFFLSFILHHIVLKHSITFHLFIVLLSYYIQTQNSIFLHYKSISMGCIISKEPEPPLPHTPEPIDNILDENNYPSLQKAINQKEFYHYTFTRFRDQVYLHDEKGNKVTDSQTVRDSDSYKQYLKVLNNSLHRNSKAIKDTLCKLYRNYKLKQIYERDKKLLSQRELAYISKVDIDQHIIKFFLFFFTADQIFPKYLKNTIRSAQYDQICHIVDLLREHVAEKVDQQEKDSILKKNQYKLYRGFGQINTPTMLQIDKTGAGNQKFFGNFYLLDHQKKNVLGSNSYLVIQLDANHPHECMIIKEPYCNPREKLIILFPFFYFQVEKSSMTPTKNQIYVKQVYPIQV